MDVERYLGRIGMERPTAPSAQVLRMLHRAHMLCVPFESYDCAFGRPVTTDVESIFSKIVERRRGGFCFELNGLFAWLLGELGFPVTLLSARPYIVGKEDEAEPEFAHLALLVEADGRRWLGDVGYGDGFLEPLLLDQPRDQVRENGRAYRIVPGAEREPWRQLQLYGGDDAEGYLFSLVPRRLGDFEEMCRYYSTSADSSFVRTALCSMATETGRLTLAGRRRLIVTEHGVRTERDVVDASDERNILSEQFGIDLGDG